MGVPIFPYDILGVTLASSWVQTAVTVPFGMSAIPTVPDKIEVVVAGVVIAKLCFS